MSWYMAAHPPNARALRERILAYRRAHPDRAEFADRLLEGVALIEERFSGAKQQRLLVLASDTLERHERIRRSSERAREALARLRREREKLRRLFAARLARRPGRLLH